MRRRAAVRWRVPLGVSLLLHGAALLFVWTTWQAAGEPALPRAALAVRLLDAARPRETAAPAAVTTEREARATRAAAPRAKIADVPDGPVQASTPDAAVQQPADRPLDPDGIARAAREVARTPSLAQRSNELIGHRPPPTAQQTLGSEIASAAKPECLKGGSEGYNKQNYGLFAIPLLIADAATGRCRD